MPSNLNGHSKDKVQFLAAEYNGRKATVRRTPNYKDTIVSVKRAFKPLRTSSPDDIEIWAWFDEHADLIRVTDELWAEVLPQLTSVKIFLDGAEGGVITRNAVVPSVAEEHGVQTSTDFWD
ncbi:hypothetical protein FRC10_003407 [Ceratobasidium sp. 414]|nr:hypothetical protein FRC10_003407 [Ceratobasidium sp. 414]